MIDQTVLCHRLSIFWLALKYGSNFTGKPSHHDRWRVNHYTNSDEYTLMRADQLRLNCVCECCCCLCEINIHEQMFCPNQWGAFSLMMRISLLSIGQLLNNTALVLGLNAIATQIEFSKQTAPSLSKNWDSGPKPGSYLLSKMWSEEWKLHLQAILYSYR